MLTRIRDVRKAKGLALHEVASRCEPPTTAQTIGRLETGTRTVSVGWLNRIAHALGVDAAELVTLPDRVDVAVAAVLTADGPVAPTRTRALLPPTPTRSMVGIAVEAAQGDYRAGDQLWLDQLPAAQAARALNCDVLVPRPAGRFAFGRLVAAEPGEDGAKLQLLPLTPGARQLVIADAPWLAVVRTLVREL